MSDQDLRSPMAVRTEKSPPWLVSKLTDFACFVIIATPIVFLRFNGAPYEKGFFCGDESIALPYKLDTISNGVLALICLVIPALVFALIEAVRFATKTSHAVERDAQKTCVTRMRSNAFVNDSVTVYSVFLFGFIATFLLTDIGKFSLGVLRPHFLSVCHPNWSKINCSKGYITNVFCEGDPDLIKTARLSFPSGHSSLSAFSMGFLVLYMEARVNIPWSKFLKLTMQLVPVSFSMFCGYSRIFDNMHHWSDVLGGFALGIVMALIFSRQILPRVSEPTEKDLVKHKDEAQHGAKDYDNNFRGSDQLVMNLQDQMQYTYDSDSAKASSI